MARTRLDEALVARGLYATRSRARDAILRGAVFIDGLAARKPAQTISPAAAITLEDSAKRYVSRAALKLLHAIDLFNLSPHGKACLDIGASTGGFTQVLLERGASTVTAIDVGHSQLHGMLNGHPRLRLIEGLNARDLTLEHLVQPPEFITADVSFISLTLALPPALAMAAPSAVLVALIKPQFEAGRAALDGQGIVRDPAIHTEACQTIARFLETRGWQVVGTIPSPVDGSDGNREFLITAAKPA